MPDTFCYRPTGIDPASGYLTCAFSDANRTYVERIRVAADRPWSAGADGAARLTHLLAGVSYYKATAPPVVDVSALPLAPGEGAFLRHFLIEGLGEFAYRNQIDLAGITVVGAPSSDTGRPPTGHPVPRRPLIPFGGGIDSIVTVDALASRFPEAALFILNRPNDRMAAIEAAAEVTGLPIVRAERELDPQILRSAELGLLNGHVPITGVLSAIAVLAAAAGGYDAVVMSNERSASAGNVAVAGREINHQWSKSWDFEQRFAAVVDGALGGEVQYFSALRDCSELWIARRFAGLRQYHQAFRSCNRAFAQDPARRAERWCGHCDKCCFIDLILAPFLPVDELRHIFDGNEPLSDPALADRFRLLLALTPGAKPWECVGDVEECRAALVLAAQRSDRQSTPLLARLLRELGPAAADAARHAVPTLLAPGGPHHVPHAYAPAS